MFPMPTLGDALRSDKTLTLPFISAGSHRAGQLHGLSVLPLAEMQRLPHEDVLCVPVPSICNGESPPESPG
jgi:hypothetical protein